jgi:hypothetical protein
VLGERGEALEVGEEQTDLALLAAEAGPTGVGCELARELGRQVRPEQPVDAVDLAGVGEAVCRRLASAPGASSSAGCGGRYRCKPSFP